MQDEIDNLIYVKDEVTYSEKGANDGKIGCALVITSAALMCYGCFALSCYLIPKATAMGIMFWFCLVFGFICLALTARSVTYNHPRPLWLRLSAVFFGGWLGLNSFVYALILALDYMRKP